jgi:hypothetical protein
MAPRHTGLAMATWLITMDQTFHQVADIEHIYLNILEAGRWCIFKSLTVVHILSNFEVVNISKTQSGE